MSSSEFDIDIDEDDLREIEIIEQEAIQQTQQTPQSSAVVVTESPTSLKREPASTGIQSPRTLPWTRLAPNSSPGRTLPWQSSLQSSSFKPTQDPGQAVKGRARPNEPRTHHYLDTTAAKTWIYPTNVSFREYQFNIVLRALFDNVLVSLPTGLGKTFIAATLMYNFYRWFPRSKIMFVAPTKPLVQQQVEACFQICGVPYSQTAMLTGNVSKSLRALAYEERRVFYMTPQTLSNDIKTGICDPKSIVCLVIDEAHRGTGNYAYGECVNLIRKRNPSFRILALSATPGSSVEQVQNVITALCIAKIEIRTEESMDLRQYVHKRNIDVVALPLSEEIITLRDLYSKILQKYLDRVKNLNDYRLRDPLTLSLFGVKSAKDAFFASPAGRTATFAYKGMIAAVLGVLTSLAHAQSLLLYHGIQPFYGKLVELQHDYQSQGPKISKTKAELLSNPDFQELMSQLKMLVDNPNTSGHPKLDRAASIIIDHFMRMQDQGQETRVMAFCQFRASAAELVKQLKRHEPIIKPTIFVGQAVAKGTAGMKQKEQLDVIQRFKSGYYNVMVATCIGEEGLDIGDIDLILCYDSNSSPIRMLQRMGRTGRKREGRVVFLLTEGKEERDHARSQDTYTEIQQKIESGKFFEFNLDNSPRIVPAEYTPDCVKRLIIPPEETLEDLELKVDRRKKAEKKERDWSLPENAQKGFVSAKALAKRKREESETEEEEDEVEDEEEEPKYMGFIHPDSLMSPFLSKDEEKKVRAQRVKISRKDRRMDIIDADNGFIPSSSVRNRLLRTKDSMRNPKQPRIDLTKDDLEELNTTPPNLIARTPNRGLTERKSNNRLSNGSAKVHEERRTSGALDWTLEKLPSSDDDDLPDLATAILETLEKNTKRKSTSTFVRNLIPKKENVGGSSARRQSENTPRKKIRIAALSDEEE